MTFEKWGRAGMIYDEIHPGLTGGPTPGIGPDSGCTAITLSHTDNRAGSGMASSGASLSLA